MKNPFERKMEVEPVRNMYFFVITPPEGPEWWGVRLAFSEDVVRQEMMARTSKTRREISGRVSVTLLRPPAGMDYLEKDATITYKSKEDFLKNLLVSSN